MMNCILKQMDLLIHNQHVAISTNPKTLKLHSVIKFCYVVIDVDEGF